MSRNREIMSPAAHIKGGVRVSHFKNTAELETVRMPSPEKVIIPMDQHIGAPCVPIVKVGDKVKVGQKIADSDQPFSAPIYASVSGTVTGMPKILSLTGRFSDTVVIESDGLDELAPGLETPKVDTVDDFIKAVRESGLVGFGGAGFPSHIKLTPRSGVKIDTLIINAAECEPYITVDYRECIENTDDILNGVYLIKNILDIDKVIIAVEDNKPKAIEKMLEVSSDIRDVNNDVRLLELKSHYPQGAEKVLIYTATGRKLPLGKLPADVGCIVMNVTSLAVLYRYLTDGIPVTHKRLTVDGSAVAEPKNVLVPIGTRVCDVIDFCGGFKSEPHKILFGGPMMGICVCDPESPVTKRNNAILAFDKAGAKSLEPGACISCGRCVKACPMRLTPCFIETAYNARDLDRVKKLCVEYCIECGCCSFSCPAHRPLTQVMRLSKQALKAPR